jgi:DNA-binding beta-propeller fold protein YncE
MTTVGDGDFKYEVDRDWLLRNTPRYWDLGQCADVAVDSTDTVWVFSRSEHPVTAWTTDGEFVGSWGDRGPLEGEWRVPHGMFIDSEDNIWLADHQTHTVTKHALNGEVLLQLGTFGYANITVTTNGGQGAPFNMPTGIAIAEDGKIFTSDGYANRRVHRFSASGELEHSWGEAGTGPGQFAIIHKIAIGPDGLVYICDRENNRIQIFDQDGNYQREWNDVVGPGDIYFASDGNVYVAEQGGGNGVSIWTQAGELVTRWRGNADACVAAHGLWLDSKRNIYVAEIGDPGKGQRVTKFSRI